jgi:soluble lytic murein transglycosylase-like protein
MKLQKELLMGLSAIPFPKYVPPSSDPQSSDRSLLDALDPDLVPARADVNNSEIAQQQRPPAQGRQPQPIRRVPLVVPSPKDEQITLSREAERDGTFQSAYEKLQRDERQKQWEQIVAGSPVPVFPDSRIQAPLPQDWRSTINKIDPRYLAWTEAAARKRGIPVELLARHLYRESTFNSSANIDPRTGFPLPNKAGGIAQMFPPALADIGIVPDKDFWSNPQRQIEAGAGYLALLRRQYGDWPKAVAAYHFGRTRFGQWLVGKTPDFEAPLQRKAHEGLLWLEEKKNRTGAESQQLQDRFEALKTDLNQFQEMTRHLPYVFLGDPRRYD